jgi:hypothetical protein
MEISEWLRTRLDPTRAGRGMSLRDIVYRRSKTTATLDQQGCHLIRAFSCHEFHQPYISPKLAFSDNLARPLFLLDVSLSLCDENPAPDRKSSDWRDFLPMK